MFTDTIPYSLNLFFRRILFRGLLILKNTLGKSGVQDVPCTAAILFHLEANNHRFFLEPEYSFQGLILLPQLHR